MPDNLNYENIPAARDYETRSESDEMLAEQAAAQARAEAAAHNPHLPPHSEDAELQKQRNLRNAADTVENRLARLEAKVFETQGSATEAPTVDEGAERDLGQNPEPELADEASQD